MTADTIKNAQQTWARIIGTQEHFNLMMVQVRNHLLTLVTAVVGASALSLQKDISIPICGIHVHISTLLLLAGVPILIGFYVTEKGYHNLLVGAVKQGTAIEKEFEILVPGIGLTHSISKESKNPIFFLKISSAARLRLFYILLGTLLISGALLTLRYKFRALDNTPEPISTRNEITSAPATSPRKYVTVNDPRAGTTALMKFKASGADTLITERVAQMAMAYVDKVLPTSDRSNLVAVFDIDETALSTWEILSEGEFTWDAERFHTFVHGKRAKAIPPVKALYQKLIAAGVSVVFITGRSEDLREPTEKNLSAEGFSGYSQIIMKPVTPKVSTKQFKEDAREALRKSGKKIILTIGDQVDDLDPQNPQGSFLIPNPYY